jgi:hypothetical protein
VCSNHAGCTKQRVGPKDRLFVWSISDGSNTRQRFCAAKYRSRVFGGRKALTEARFEKAFLEKAAGRITPNTQSRPPFAIVLLMRNNLPLLLAAIASGALLTLGSAAIARKSQMSWPCSDHLLQVDRGFPLPFITLKPSVSLCQSVERLSVLWEGNAYHKESVVAAAVDFVFWSAFSAAGLLSLRWYRQLR